MAKYIWNPPIANNPDAVKLVLISECAATEPKDNYFGAPDSLFDRTTLDAFALAGLHLNSIYELTDHGIHLTTVLREPKNNRTIGSTMIKEAVPTLEAELTRYPNARVYMLMGDVAISAINHIARRRFGKRAIPAGSTYRIRVGEFYFGDIRVFPSYLQAGPAWYIEASKRSMVAEDLRIALRIAGIDH